MAGRLTTHVLDTLAGRPAAGLALTLKRPSDGLTLAHRITNEDGRVEGPILEGTQFRRGIYELSFHVGDYFRRAGVELPEPAFLEVVLVRFGLSEDTHYHVPLLVSPYGYSFYRGS
jgi:5-hydroxyisourate hydrolase